MSDRKSNAESSKQSVLQHGAMDKLTGEPKRVIYTGPSGVEWPPKGELLSPPPNPCTCDSCTSDSCTGDPCVCDSCTGG
jgi:hypothetical protein